MLPTRKGVTTVLDLGANVDCTPEHLLQFAVMGSALVAAVDGIERPSVGLLNIGEEDIKGNDVVKQAGELLKADRGLNFYGNVEGNDIYKGTTDVVVCDGFVGNVALKILRRARARCSRDFLREEFTRNPSASWRAGSRCRCCSAFKRRVDPRRYNGATLLGLKGMVVKSHGSADALRVPLRPEEGVREEPPRRARPHRAAHRGDAGADVGPGALAAGVVDV